MTVAVASICSVGVFTDRMERALSLGATELLAADLLILSTDPIGEAFEAHALRRGLRTAPRMRPSTVFPSPERRGSSLA